MIVIIIDLESRCQIPTLKSALEYQSLVCRIFLFIERFHTLKVYKAFFTLLRTLWSIWLLGVFEDSSYVE